MLSVLRSGASETQKVEALQTAGIHAANKLSYHGGLAHGALRFIRYRAGFFSPFFGGGFC